MLGNGNVQSLISLNAHPSKGSNTCSWQMAKHLFLIHFNNLSLICSTWTWRCEVASNNGVLTSIGCGRSRIADTNVYTKNRLGKIERILIREIYTWYKAVYASLTPCKTSPIVHSTFSAPVRGHPQLYIPLYIPHLLFIFHLHFTLLTYLFVTVWLPP